MSGGSWRKFATNHVLDLRLLTARTARIESELHQQCFARRVEPDYCPRTVQAPVFLECCLQVLAEPVLDLRE